MKTFQTIKEAASFISKHNESSSHKEKDINEVVMFGMGCVYAYRKEASAARLARKYDHLTPTAQDIEQVTRNYAAYIVESATFEI